MMADQVSCVAALRGFPCCCIIQGEVDIEYSSEQDRKSYSIAVAAWHFLLLGPNVLLQNQQSIERDAC